MGRQIVCGEFASSLYNKIGGDSISGHGELIEAIKAAAKEDGWNENILYECGGDVAIAFISPMSGVMLLWKKEEDLYFVDVKDLMTILDMFLLIFSDD